MGKTQRIRTQIGINKQINVELEQDFDFLEILSLTIQQQDVYTKSCADYGVVVGRVTANNGYGIPNTRVSIFIPIENIDKFDPTIFSIYPYTNTDEKNEDGYRYNLLPYEQSHSGHVPTGTFPSRDDVMVDKTAIEIYDKYYKYTVKTNDSGDFLIMGVPLGVQEVFVDMDLSDIGEFSLTPQDLIRMGRATEAQVAGSRFKSSTDLNSLPQIVSLKKSIDVAPLWGDPDICQIAISRVDFDLRNDANIDIQPTAVFMGSMFSSPDKFRIRKNCKPRDNMGNLCGLVASPGQILALRQTIAFDTSGRPILEEYKLEKSGNVIDDSGSWLVELPMNLDYVITNEYGDKIISNDPTIGIPTKSKYRFKVKWRQPPKLTEQTRRAYFLVPNIKEYGWNSSGTIDPTGLPPTSQDYKAQYSSYYFGLDWSGYTNGFTGQREIDRTNEIIDCEDTFFEMSYNRVYTVAGLIDQWKKGNKGRFIGIKEIDDDACDSTVNKFPVNEGFRNFDFLFFLFSLLLTILMPIFFGVLIVMHIALFLYKTLIDFLCALCQIHFLGIWPFRWLCNWLGIRCPNIKDYTMRIPMITYPDCDVCDCKQELKTVKSNAQFPDEYGSGNLSYLSNPDTYYPKLELFFSANTEPSIDATMTAEALGGRATTAVKNDPTQYKLPKSQILTTSNNDQYFATSEDLPLGERINLFNSREKYFRGINFIKVEVEPSINVGQSHADNTITILSKQIYEPGTLLSSVNILNSQDKNWLYSANTPSGVITGISGTPYTSLAPTSINITYATSRTTSQNVIYNLPYGSDIDNYNYPADIEYFQVVTAITWSDFIRNANSNTVETFPNLLNKESTISYWKHDSSLGVFTSAGTNRIFKPIDYVEDIDEQYILVLQRGVDPYSPKYTQRYSLGVLFGTTVNDTRFIFTASTRLNIPIQVDSNSTISVQGYSQNEMYYQSYFFNPGIPTSTQTGLAFSSYTTTNTGYYGLQQINFLNQSFFRNSFKSVISKQNNDFYSTGQLSNKYSIIEDVTGLGAMGCSVSNNVTTYNLANYFYYTKTIYGGITNSALTINTRTKNVLRTDRLPSSDILDGGDWSNNPSLLQQNSKFVFYSLSEDENGDLTPPIALGASIPTADIEGLPNATTVISSFDCDNMVSLNCYTGFGSQFGIIPNCVDEDNVDKGCYMFMRKPLTDLGKDIKTLGEWSYRFRFFYGLCRGILSQTFTNNWVNGTLYAFPIQADTTFDKFNKPINKFCSDLVFFDRETINFYYRSSPFNDATNKFVGRPSSNTKSVNTKNLLFPTTIVNLGMKDSFYDEISFEPSTQSYILKDLDSTSYGDVSDIINLFVISRMTDAKFLSSIFAAGSDSLNEIFTRFERRVDGDLAQLMSINSEVGVIKFSPEYYEIDPNNQYNPTNILGTAGDPTIAIWFSSATEDLQLRDFLTPGRINFRGTPTSNFSPYQYGIKSQTVPFYRWNLNTTSRIFGDQYNNWLTDINNILSTKYQSLDRMRLQLPTYFQSATSPQVTDLYNRGYIFSVDANGNYSELSPLNQSFIVGAPFHFYFGTVKGDSALDKFKTKYSIDE